MGIGTIFSAGVVALSIAASGGTSAAAEDGPVVAGSSDTMVWNGVVVSHDRIFVSGPRWAGGHAPALATLKDQALTPYPDASWNAWSPGGDATMAFVNVNAIHLDKAGQLWIVDTGTPEFGGDLIPDGAKIVKIDLATGRVARIYPLHSAVREGSYVDDIRPNGTKAYLTDAGKTPAIIVLDLKTGGARRVLEGAAAVKWTPGRQIVVEGKTVRSADGAPLEVNADPLDLSPDGQHFYFGALSGPWFSIETRLLDDPHVAAGDLARAVEPWADLPPIGGAIMADDGSLYFTELATNSLKRRKPDGTISTLLNDSRLHWVDAPFIDARRQIWLPVPQLDRAAPFNGGKSKIERPVLLFRYTLPADK